MNPTTLLHLLAEVQRGTLTPEQASARLADLPFEDLDYAKIDHHRTLRSGLPEVIYAAGKSPAQTAEIFTRMAGFLPDRFVDMLTERVNDALGKDRPQAPLNSTHQ